MVVAEVATARTQGGQSVGHSVERPVHLVRIGAQWGTLLTQDYAGPSGRVDWRIWAPDDKLSLYETLVYAEVASAGGGDFRSVVEVAVTAALGVLNVLSLGLHNETDVILHVYGVDTTSLSGTHTLVGIVTHRRIAVGDVAGLVGTAAGGVQKVEELHVRCVLKVRAYEVSGVG